MKMIDHNHFICHLILGTFTEYPVLQLKIHIPNIQDYHQIKIEIAL